MSTTEAKTDQFCTFTVDGMLFGIEVLAIQEVLKGRELEPVPLSHDAIEGLLNLRGQIVTAIDLRHRLGRPPRAPDASTMLLVTPTSGGIVAFLADSIGDVTEVTDASFEPPPRNLTPEARRFVSGVYKLSGTLLHVLEVERAADLSL
jgi:purine-binding chemotaxis protein CheW